MPEKLLLIFLIIISLSVIAYVLYLVLRSPFQFPHFVHVFDVSGKRNPDIENHIDEFLNERNFDLILTHEKGVKLWKKDCQKKLEVSRLKKLRTKQYQDSLKEEDETYIFYLTREKTRYTQKNYVKTPYKVTQIEASFTCNYQFLFHRNEKLRSINYECTLKEYHSKNQRKLMTKELREQIIIRDNYTCQLCGKYMPDEVGLQIDHIVPVSKGGKSVPSNLQVLCSKCNGRKSSKHAL